MTSIYRLYPVCDVPDYEGFAPDPSAPNRSALTIPKMMHAVRGRWEPLRLRPTWQPLRVVGRVRKFNDYPCVVTRPAFSARAVAALSDLLEPNGELLPLVSDVGDYSAYNVLTMADVLNHDRSEIDWGDKPLRASRIWRYEFREEGLDALGIFRLPEQVTEILVTEVFAERVRRHKLTGMVLTKVWPLPPKVKWWDMWMAQQRLLERGGKVDGLWVKGNTVVVALSLSQPRGSQAERQRVNAVLDSLDALLVRDSAEPTSGSLEGHDYVQTECRLFLSCPDADALVAHLRPWLKELRWPEGLRVIKRYGEYVDADAPEQEVDLQRDLPR